MTADYLAAVEESANGGAVFAADAVLRLVALVREAEVEAAAERERWRIEHGLRHGDIAERDAARAALAALVADLRALAYERGRTVPRHPDYGVIKPYEVRALADRYDGGEGS